MIGKKSIKALLQSVSGTASVKNMEVAIESSKLDVDDMIKLAETLIPFTHNAEDLTRTNLEPVG